MKKTKILATIGPSSNSYKILKDMIIAGANGVRLNLSHGTRQEHEQVINHVKKLRKELNLNIAIVIDTRGPEVRVGNFENGKILVKKGQLLTLTSAMIVGNEQQVSISEPKIINVLKVGGKVLANDGLLRFKIVEKQPTKIVVKALNSGVLSNRKSLFFPNVEYNIPYINKADKEDIEWAIKAGADYFAISFVNTANNVNEIRALINKNGGKQEIISKIESKLGVKNIDEIIEVSDGIMVARGDLGVEYAIEKVPHLQKQIISKTLQCGKFVITATEMLESMTNNIRPTRAEVSDVANAVLDGSSAIMLSGETSVGKYPVNVVKTMANIAVQTEKNVKYDNNFNNLKFHTKSIPDIISYNTVSSAFSCNAKAIVVITNSGRTPRLMARFKPQCPIIAITDEQDVFDKCSLIDSVAPVMAKIPYGNLDKILQLSKDVSIKLGFAKKNDLIIISSASRYNNKDTDFIKIEKL